MTPLLTVNFVEMPWITNIQKNSTAMTYEAQTHGVMGLRGYWVMRLMGCEVARLRGNGSQGIKDLRGYWVIKVIFEVMKKPDVMGLNGLRIRIQRSRKQIRLVWLLKATFNFFVELCFQCQTLFRIFFHYFSLFNTPKFV